MEPFLANPVAQAYIGATILLSLNVLFLGSASAVTRAKAKQVINPEDVGGKDMEVVFEEGNALTQRCQRAHRNSLENIPVFLITGFLLTLTGISVAFAGTLFGIFVVARLTHSFMYVTGTQPWRTGSFAVGFFTQLTVLGYLGYAVLTA